jgi:hypothetical protein
MHREGWTIASGAVLMMTVAALLVGCGGGGGGATAPVPSIFNINSSTTPSSPVGLPIEINGTGFQSAPGQVRFTQGSIVATVTPNASGWSDTGIVVVVPSGDGTTSFTVPGTVTVTVVTSGGTSNGVVVALVQTLTFNVNNVTWTTTTALPTALTGLRAVVVPASNTSAFVVVTGGFDGTNDTTTVLSNTLAPSGLVGSSWKAITTNALPESRAHHGMVVAHPGNSLVPANSRFIYVIGGQKSSTDTPGGTATVFMASVDATSGVVGAWSQLSNSLPEPLVGPAVTLFNGSIYVVGGLRPDGTPSSSVYSAQVQSDGTLNAWAKSPNPYPVGISFATAFGFAGKLYVLDGDTLVSLLPNDQGTAGVKDARFAPIRNGAVGTWTATNQTIKSRKKHITWSAFGQVINAEGIYEGSPGSTELERTLIQSDGTLGSWNGITASSNQINANVYNAAAVVSPLQSSTGTPRFLLLGGQAFATVPPGPLNAAVHVNNAP